MGFIAAKPPGSVGGLDSCLLFVDETSSWYMAKLDCESRGAELADVSYKERVENINYLRAKYGLLSPPNAACITVKNFNSLILCLLERSIKLASRPLQQYRSVKYATEDRQSLPQ